MRIIVLNCYSRNSLAVINSLDKSYKIIGGTARKNLLFKPDRIFKSPYVSLIFRYTDPVEYPEIFKTDIINACNTYKADAVIPTGTAITNYLSYYKSDIAESTKAKILVEDYQKLSQLADKWITCNVCTKLNIPIPKATLIQTKEDVEQICDSFSFPIILKPRTSYASKGIQFFHNRESFKKYILNSKIDSSCLVQELIEGELHDVALFAKDGKVLSILTQKRLLSFYDFGGGGIINKTTYEPQLMEYGTRIAEYLKWNGVLEIDFIKQESNYYLLECNPKIWGTTHLTVKAGLNVVQQLIDTFVLNKPVEKRQNSYKVGLVYKWLFPECVSSWFHKPMTWEKFSKMEKRFPFPRPRISVSMFEK
ncbi:MAG: hypothetical protein DRG39_04620, partial [Deltaproteobacteria bacterium]